MFNKIKKKNLFSFALISKHLLRLRSNYSRGEYCREANNYVHSSMRSRIKGQAILEYAALIGLAVLALFALSMREYLRNSISSRMRSDLSRTFGEEQYYGTNTNIDLHLILNETLSVTGNNPI